MTNIRASGFDSKNELQDHLTEVTSAEGPIGSGDGADLRAAEVELAWLRKEIAELQEQFSIVGGKSSEPQSLRADTPAWLKVAVAAAATCTVGALIQWRLS